MSSPHRPPLLVVEDSDEDFNTVQEALRKAGLDAEVQRASSGEECLELLRQDPLRPALILMDLNMPGIDGRQTLEAIKKDADLKALPVVVLTTSDDPNDIGRCYAAGANAYHVKPVRYPEHLKVLTSILTYWLEQNRLPVRRPLTR